MRRERYVWALVAAALMIALPVAAATRRRALEPRLFPPCSIVTGTPAVTFTRDDGKTLAAIAQPLTGTAYTFGLAMLDIPGTLLSLHDHLLSISKDGGCTWSPVQSIDSSDYYPPAIVPARGGRAYLWSDNRSFLARYSSVGVDILKPPVAILGIAVDAADADRVRIGGTDGSIWESRDAGSSWSELAVAPVGGPTLFYRFAFDPSNLNHVIAGAASSGAITSMNGGMTWTSASFGSGRVNVFNLVFAPSDSMVVWAMGLNISESDANNPSQGRHIYRSTDGGFTFSPVIDQSPSVTLINGPVMAADPVDANVLYFVFGSFFQNYGTDLFRYDASTAILTRTHNGYNGIDAIAFSKSDPTLLYLGLRVEHVQ